MTTTVEKPLRIFAVDPGGTTGFALIEGAKVIQAGEIPTADFHNWLAEEVPSDIQYLIVEDYKIRPERLTHANHAWASGLTIQLIGALKFWAHLNEVTLVLQQAYIKATASGWTGLPYNPKSPVQNQHAYDAAMHGVYFLIKKKLITIGEFKGAQK